MAGKTSYCRPFFVLGGKGGRGRIVQKNTTFLFDACDRAPPWICEAAALSTSVNEWVSHLATIVLI
jgi:hypothetical protein